MQTGPSAAHRPEGNIVLIVARQAMLADAVAADLVRRGLPSRAGLLEPAQERRSAEVLVVDGDLPRDHVHELVNIARTRCLDMGVVLLTSHERSSTAYDGLGAYALVSRGSGVDALARAVTRAREKSPPVRPVRSRKPRARVSARELQVLHALATGATNEQAAAALGISASTVRTHVESILVKLGARNRFEAVHVARGCHLLQVEPTTS